MHSAITIKYYILHFNKYTNNKINSRKKLRKVKKTTWAERHNTHHTVPNEISGGCIPRWSLVGVL